METSVAPRPFFLYEMKDNKSSSETFSENLSVKALVDLGFSHQNRNLFSGNSILNKNEFDLPQENVNCKHLSQSCMKL